MTDDVKPGFVPLDAADKLRSLANWFDREQAAGFHHLWIGNEVQRDLRKWAGQIVHAANEHPRLVARVAELEAALAFYANQANYYLGDYESRVVHDHGQIARDALNKEPK